MPVACFPPKERGRKRWCFRTESMRAKRSRRSTPLLRQTKMAHPKGWVIFGFMRKEGIRTYFRVRRYKSESETVLHIETGAYCFLFLYGCSVNQAQVAFYFFDLLCCRGQCFQKKDIFLCYIAQHRCNIVIKLCQIEQVCNIP